MSIVPFLGRMVMLSKSVSGEIDKYGGRGADFWRGKRTILSVKTEWSGQNKVPVFFTLIRSIKVT